jgi:hypothetical protein
MSDRVQSITRIIIPALVVLVVSGSASAGEPQVCQRLIETYFVDELVPDCEVGDTLVLQILSDVAPGPVVGDLCDLRHELWTEVPDDILPMLILDASARIKSTYKLQDELHKNVIWLKGSDKQYDNVTVYVRERGSLLTM